MMKTNSLKKNCLRVITVALTLCLVLSSVAFAAVTLDTDVTATDVTMTVNCGTAYAGKNIVVQVFEPVGNFDDLLGNDNGYNETDVEIIEKTLCCVYQGKLNDQGKLTFTFAPTGDKGRYAVRVSVPGLTAPEELDFEFVSEGDAKLIIEKLVKNPSVSAVDELFELPENENVYKPYQILDLDSSNYYSIYAEDDSALVDAVNTYIYNGIVANASIDPAGFFDLFEDAVLVEYLNILTGDEMIGFIANSASDLGIADNEAYTGIFLDEERFDSVVKANFLATMEPAELSLKTAAEVGTAICEALVDAEEAAILENFKTLTGDSLLAYVESKAEFLGYASSKEFTDILKNKDRFTKEVKDAFLSDVHSAGFAALKDIPGEISKLLVKNFVSYVSAPGVLNTFILDFETELKVAGADVAEYAAYDKPNEVCMDLIAAQPYASAEAFAKKLNALTPESDDDEDEDNRPSAPSGTGGGGISVSGSMNSNASVSIPVANPEEAKPETNAVFADIAQVAWANEAITTLKEKGIVSGRGDGNFCPQDKVTREEFVKMLSVALGLDTAVAEGSFSDIAGTEWYAPYVYAACKAGIANGIGDAFGVGHNITRQDMAVLIARAIEHKAVALQAVREGMAFNDEFAPYAKDAVATLWGAGLINGISETEFAPAATASRAEAAKMLYEMLKAIE